MPKKIPHMKSKAPNFYELENDHRRHLFGEMSSLDLSLKDLKNLVKFLEARKGSTLTISPQLEGPPQFYCLVGKNAIAKVEWSKGEWRAFP